MKLSETRINGCFEIILNNISDKRGSFLKTYHVDFFKENNLEYNWKEEYFTTSTKNVLRGMHFQEPPFQHSKLVSCLSGKVLDVIIDLRKSSSSFKKVISIELSESSNKMIYIPEGCAHGFLSLVDNSIMFYKVSSIYNGVFDKGIHWNSIGFDWPQTDLIISDRDLVHPELSEYSSLF